MMQSQELWTAVDTYFANLLHSDESVLDEALAASAAGGLPPMNVAPNQGKLLQLFAKMHGTRSILEIGTLGGYSTIWLAGALPADGKLVTLEAESGYAEVARANIARAGFAEIVDVRQGVALDVLPQIEAEGIGPFDFVFIDADKRNNLEYFEWALKLTQTGSVIIVDNVVRDGDVIDAGSTDPSVIGVRRFAASIAKDERVSATALQTVGSKGYDGFVLAVVI
ncbi:O-methyltransferase [soil metagenome]